MNNNPEYHPADDKIVSNILSLLNIVSNILSLLNIEIPAKIYLIFIIFKTLLCKVFKIFY